jgi:hypothetical protein
LPFNKNCLDAIVSGESIEHIYEADIQPTPAECRCVVRVKDRLLMIRPALGSAKRRKRSVPI